MIRRATIFDLNVFVIAVLSVSACSDHPVTPLSPTVTASATSTSLVSAASSEQIRISRGTFIQPADLTGRFDLEGTQGLRMEGTVSPHTAVLPWEFCFRIVCDAGEVVNLRSGYGARPPVFTGSGQVTLRGKTYSLWSGDEAFADFQFDGALTLPEFTNTSGPVAVSTPFTFVGALHVPRQSQPGTYAIYQLQGSGVATAMLAPHPVSGTGWIVTSVTYDFGRRAGVTPR